MNSARVITETPRHVLKDKTCAFLSSAETSLCRRKVGGGKIDNAQRTLGRGKRGLAFHRPSQAYYLINATGIPTGSLRRERGLAIKKGSYLPLAHGENFAARINLGFF